MLHGNDYNDDVVELLLVSFAHAAETLQMLPCQGKTEQFLETSSESSKTSCWHKLEATLDHRLVYN